MATVSWEENNLPNILYFDATMSEQHDGVAEVTEHDVERGADLADHVRARRPELSLVVMVTNHPLQSIGRLQGAWMWRTFSTDQRVTSEGTADGSVRLVGIKPVIASKGFVAPYKPPFTPRIHFPPKFIPGMRPNEPVSLIAQAFTFLTQTDRLKDVWEALEKLRLGGTPCTVSTRLQDYENMIITRVGAPVTARDAIEFTLSFKQIGYYESLTFSAVNKVAKVATKAAAVVQDQGPKPLRTTTNQGRQSVVDAGAQNAANIANPVAEATVAQP